MEILGSDDECILVLKSDFVVLPNTEERAFFNVDQIKSEDIIHMMDNPTSIFYGVLAHEDTHAFGKFMGVAVMCQFSFIRLTNDGVELNIKGCKRVRIGATTTIGGRVLAIDLEEVVCPNNKPAEVAEMISVIIAYMETKSPENAEILKRVKDPSKFADMCLNETLADDDNRLGALNILSVLTRMKKVHMPIETTKTHKRGSDLPLCRDSRRASGDCI